MFKDREKNYARPWFDFRDHVLVVAPDNTRSRWRFAQMCLSPRYVYTRFHLVMDRIWPQELPEPIPSSKSVTCCFSGWAERSEAREVTWRTSITTDWSAISCGPSYGEMEDNFDVSCCTKVAQHIGIAPNHFHFGIVFFASCSFVISVAGNIHSFTFMLIWWIRGKREPKSLTNLNIMRWRICAVKRVWL